MNAALSEFELNEDVIKNCLYALGKNYEDAKILIHTLKQMHEDGTLESLMYKADRGVGLSYIFFTIKVTIELYKRCGNDICVVDSTHNVTKYAYKLVTLLLVDSCLVSRPAAFSFLLSESAQKYCEFFSDFCLALHSPLPELMFTDQDSSIISSLSLLDENTAIPERGIVRVTCLWHLLDFNMRNHPVSTSKGGSSSWGSFRNVFITTRNSSYE